MLGHQHCVVQSSAPLANESREGRWLGYGVKRPRRAGIRRTSRTELGGAGHGAKEAAHPGGHIQISRGESIN